MNRSLIPLLVFLILIPIFVIGLTRDPSEIPSPFVNEQAPSFQLSTLKDETRIVGNADFAGETVLVNVWATWCVGCRQEHDFLMQLQARGEIPIIGINWKDNRPDALRWLEALGDPYEYSGFDEDGRVGIDWGVYGAPETFLVNEEGIVLYKHLGPLDEAIWQKEFVPRLAGDT